jgi:hypothetical protein
MEGRTMNRKNSTESLASVMTTSTTKTEKVTILMILSCFNSLKTKLPTYSTKNSKILTAVK